MIGKILDEDALIMKVTMGTGMNKDGRAIELYATMTGAPMVTDVESGRSWLLDWPAIVDLAIEELDSSQQGVIDATESA